MCFAKSEIKYLSHVIGSSQHGLDPQKLHAIESVEAPTTKTNLKNALALYYHECIKNFAEVAKPLTDLSKKKAPEIIPCSDVEKNAF